MENPPFLIGKPSINGPFSMENPPFLIGKPSISMGHLYHGYVSHNQRLFHEKSWPVGATATNRSTSSFGALACPPKKQLVQIPDTAQQKIVWLCLSLSSIHFIRISL
jgi:hypothetical protein